MLDLACLPVHQIFRPNHLAPECFPNGLITEANTQDRDFAREVPDQLNADARFRRRAWARRDQDSFWAQLFQLGD